MKVLGIYGSPRKGGNSDTVLDAVLAGAADNGAELKKLFVRDMIFSGCIECGSCDTTGICALRDDMTSVYDELVASDIIVLASPVFFYGVTSQVKALVDRSQALWSRRMLAKKGEERKVYGSGRGYAAIVGATRGANRFTGCELTARYFFDALDKSYEGGIFFTAEKKNEIAGNDADRGRAYEFGKKITGAGS